MKWKLGSVLTLSTTLLTGQAWASLIGDSVIGTLELAGGNSIISGCPNNSRINVLTPFGSPRTVVATGTPEFQGSISVCQSANPSPVVESQDWSVDVQSERLVYTMGPLNDEETFSVAVLLEDLDWVDMPEGKIFGLNIIQDDIGITNTVFDAHSVGVAFTPVFPSSGTKTTIIQLKTQHAKVPEPASLGLLGLGLLGLCYCRKNRAVSARL